MSAMPPFLAACRRQPVSHTPIWIMRQAGRYLPEYRAVRSKVGFTELTRSAELACEVTLQPIRRFALDASIIFSDIMVPIVGMGVALEYAPGPVIGEPIRTMAQVDALRTLEPERDVPFVMEAIKLTRAGLPAHVPLIGFAGSPFTLFSYLVAGKPSKEFSVPRAFAQAEPEISARLMEKLADAMIVYLRAQAKAGAQALMLFESWGGLLGPSDYRGSLAHIATLDVDVIGLDWRTSLGGARKILGESKAIQGNLDPAHLFSSPTELKKRIDEVFADIGPGPGHIFNLGHGIWPETDPDSVARLVDYVYEKSAK